MRIVGCGRVKNGERYVRRWVEEMSRVCDLLCVLDDGSDDSTPRILDELAKSHKTMFLHKQRGLPKDGGRDCNTLYDMASAFKPDWILAPDIDEFVDPEDLGDVRALAQVDRPDLLGWTFPFFYLWGDERHYRADGDYASCHVIRLFRYDQSLRPPQRASHSQMCPDGLDRRKVKVAPVRMVHYGYMDREDRVAKHRFYTQRDPDPMKAGGGVSTYDHIIAEAGAEIRPYPTRTEWRSRPPSGHGRIDGMARRAHIGPGAVPGSVPDMVPVLAAREKFDEIIVENVVSLPNGFSELSPALRPGGRLDVTSLDFDQWAADLKVAVEQHDEAKKEELYSVLASRSPYWETKLRRMMERDGLVRIERLPCPGLHMVGFKPDAA